MFRLRVLVAFVLFAGLALLAQAPKPPRSAPSPHLSHVRIVRVSLAQGPVELNQQEGRGWQKLSPNAPISEADQVRTGPGGRAVIELEAGSTVKLIPNSEVTFQRLALTPKGERLTDAAVTAGTAYFTLENKDATGFRALFPEGVVTSNGHGSEFRVALADGTGEVRVLNGHAEVATAGDSYWLKKNDLLQLAETAPADLAKVKTHDSWDQWSTGLDQQARGESLKAELASYGTWNGNWWYPGGMAMGWNPYMNGTWFFDPAMGYLWDSFYPWGWAPFHYGMWWDSPLGWAWSPFGGEYFMFGPQLMLNGVAAPAGYLAPPHPPAPVIHRRTWIRGIGAIKSAGVVAPARQLGTPGWYRARALGRMARPGMRAGVSGSLAMRARLSAGQMAAERRAQSSFGRDRLRVMGPRLPRMGEVPMASWPNSASAAMQSNGSLSAAAPSAARAPMATPSPVSHVSAGSPRIPK